MVDPARLAQLEAWVEEKPDEPFTRYALALELKGLGREEDAVVQFRTLLERSPAYVPTYLMAGTLLAKLGRTGEARAVLEKGHGVARSAGNEHAAGEIQDALDGLPPEDA